MDWLSLAIFVQIMLVLVAQRHCSEIPKSGLPGQARADCGEYREIAGVVATKFNSPPRESEPSDKPSAVPNHW